MMARAAELLASLRETYGEADWHTTQVARKLQSGTNLDAIEHKYK